MREKKTYENIINLPYPQPSERPRMSRLDRAAQFAPFAALVGFDAVIGDIVRRDEDYVELESTPFE